MSEAVHASTRVVVDTNILVYCFDVDEGPKHEKARQFVAGLLRARRLLLSVQILNEFYNSVTHPKKKVQLEHHLAQRFVRRLAAGADIVPLQLSMALRAIDAVPRHGFQFWDALIWATAKEHNVPVIYTEDFQHNRDVEGVRFINPFVE